MIKVTKKILSTTAITAILNLSFQPAYAGKSDLPLNSEEMSFTQKISHHLGKKDLYKERMGDFDLEDSQTNPTITSQSGEADAIAMFFKPLIGVVSLVKQGVRFVLENPGKTITMGLLLQAKPAIYSIKMKIGC